MEDIIKRAKEGDTDSIKFILEKYKPLILKEASKYRVPGYEYEDLVQHGYLALIKAIKLYKLQSNSYNGYFIRSIKNNIMLLVRGKVKHYREIPDDVMIDNMEQEYSFTIEDQLIAYEEVKLLYEALDKLSMQERKLIEAFYINELSLNEIACDLHIKYAEAYYRKKKALEKLRRLLIKEGYNVSPKINESSKINVSPKIRCLK